MNVTSPAAKELVAEVQRLREELHRSEARFRDVIERNADAILVVDMEGAIRFVNEEAEKLFDGTAGLLVGSTFGFPLVAGETTELDLVRDHQPVTVEMRVVESQWQGEPACIATLRNVTARKEEEQHARDLIREQTARAAAEAVAGKFRFLAESTAVLSSSLDSAHTLADLARLCTDQIADWVILYSFEDDQLKRNEVVHCDASKDSLVRELRDMVVDHESAVIAKLITTREPQLIELIDEASLTTMLRDPELRRIVSGLGIASMMMVPMIARSRLLGAIAFISSSPRRLYREADLQLAIDLSARAALAIDNARLYEESRQANQAKTELLAIISHDLRTPLNSILGYGQLLNLGIPDPLAPGAAVQVERIMVSAKHQLYLIDQLLDFARLDAMHEHVELAAVDAREVIREATTLIEPEAHEKGLTLRTDMPDQEVSVVTDPDKLRQVLINLLANAVKYTGEGEVRVEVRAGPRDDVSILVHDTGIGIPADQLPHVFEPFWQADRSKRALGGGTGLGLAVVKQMTELLGGRVSATSEPGVGSSFEVSLPRKA